MGYTYGVCLALWNEALAVEIGLGVTPDDGDIKSLNLEMYRTREKARDPRLRDLSLFYDPDGKELWIIKKPRRLHDAKG